MTKKIMIVDDEPDIRNTVKTLLKKNKYEVITANNADEALKKFKAEKKKPALILLDIMMPGTPVREIIPKMKGTNIVYLTAVKITEAEKEDLLKSKNIMGFIQKPFDLDNLLKEVKKYTK